MQLACGVIDVSLTPRDDCAPFYTELRKACDIEISEGGHDRGERTKGPREDTGAKWLLRVCGPVGRRDIGGDRLHALWVPCQVDEPIPVSDYLAERTRHECHTGGRPY